MSSPFKIFRKNKKVMFAGLTIMAMIAFVVIPAVLQNSGSWQGSQDPVVVTTTKYGNLTQRELSNLRYRHECVVGILSGIGGRVFGIDEQRLRPGVESMLGGVSEEQLVNRWLEGKKASEIGIQVSDKSVRELLANNNDSLVAFFMKNPNFARYLPVLMQGKGINKLAAKDINEVLGRFKQQHLTEDMFVQMVREELKVQEFESAFLGSIRGIPPGQRWDYYCRTHQRAQIECISVPVKPFAEAIKKPDDKVLQEYFKKYEDKVADPNLPEPGFRVPQKVEVEYFVADLKKFAAPENVSDDEIQTYYEKDAKRYDELNKKVLFNKTQDAADKKAAAEKESAKKDSAEKETPAEGQKPAEEAKPAADGTSPTQPEGEKKDAEKKDGEPPAADKPAENPATNPADKPADNAGEKTSSVGSSPYHMVSLSVDENKDNPDQPKPDAPKTETPKADAPAANGDALAKPADATPTEAKPSEAAPQTPAPNEPAGAVTEQPATPRRQLTEEVRKEIRDRVAVDKVLAVFAKLETAMRENSMEWKRYDAAKLHGQTDVKEPSRLDFAGLAKQYGVESGGTGLKDLWEMRETEIGKSTRLIVEKSQVVRVDRPFLYCVFDGPAKHAEIGTHSPVVSEGGDNFFLSWKVKDIKEAAPKWDDPAVQKQVFEAWRLEQARKPALEKAKGLADQAMKSKMPLAEAFAGAADIKVISPPVFSWMTAGLDPMNPQYRLNTDVSDVDLPGEEFMKTVFTLNEMGVGTALNMPKTVAYVIQVEKFEPTTDMLWKRFLEDEFPLYASAGMEDRDAAVTALFDELKKEAGLKWERKADQREKDNSPPGD
jgi:hypothetical protein